MTVNIEQHIFSKEIFSLGDITLRPIYLEKDLDMLYDWVTKPYAKYWGMLDHSKEAVLEAYNLIENNPYHHTYIGMLNGDPIFLMERYKVSEDELAVYFEVGLNDYGMHVLVAPVQKRIPQLTWHIFSTIMEYFFSLPYVDRVVVEPDVNNDKIHVLNRRAGFEYIREIELPHKKAALAICTRKSYQLAIENQKEN